VMETPVPEKPRLARRLARPARPLERRERIVILLRDVGERAEVEAAPAGVLRRGEAGVFGENLGWRAVGEGVAESHPFGDFGDLSPIRQRLAGDRQKATLARHA